METRKVILKDTLCKVVFVGLTAGNKEVSGAYYPLYMNRFRGTIHNANDVIEDLTPSHYILLNMVMFKTKYEGKERHWYVPTSEIDSELDFIEDWK